LTGYGFSSSSGSVTIKKHSFQKIFFKKSWPTNAVQEFHFSALEGGVRGTLADFYQNSKKVKRQY
jgi:hypothetical protein